MRLARSWDREAKLLSPFPRDRGFVFKARTWDDRRRWEGERARACWLHGYVRATINVDIPIPEDLENHQRVIAALSELEDHAAAELRPKDVAEDVRVKTADEVEVDVSTRAWKVSYAEEIGG